MSLCAVWASAPEITAGGFCCRVSHCLCCVPDSSAACAWPPISSMIWNRKSRVKGKHPPSARNDITCRPARLVPKCGLYLCTGRVKSEVPRIFLPHSIKMGWHPTVGMYHTIVPRRAPASHTGFTNDHSLRLTGPFQHSVSPPEEIITEVRQGEVSIYGLAQCLLGKRNRSLALIVAVLKDIRGKHYMGKSRDRNISDEFKEHCFKC